MDKKLLVSDYDKTFYKNDEDVLKNIVAVNDFTSLGNLFVIATGRSYTDFKNITKNYKINYNYLIINHGATIMNSNDEIIKNYNIDNSILKNLEKDLYLENALSWFACSGKDSRVNFTHLNLTKINIFYKTEEFANRIINMIDEKYSNFVQVCYKNKNEIEIVSVKTNKSNAINYIKKQLQLIKKNIFTVGDSYNDIEMIKNFNGYCMKEAVKAVCDISKHKVESVSSLIYKILI